MFGGEGEARIEVWEFLRCAFRGWRAFQGWMASARLGGWEDGVWRQLVDR